MSCTQEDTLLNDHEVVEVVSVPPSLTGSEQSSTRNGHQGPGALRGRWWANAEEIVEVPMRDKKKKKKPRSFASPPPPPPPPPLPMSQTLGHIPGIPPRRRAMFLGCLQCTSIVVVLYNGSPFKFESLPHPPNTMVVTTCRSCLKTRRNFTDEQISEVATRCEEAAVALQLSAEFIQTSYMYRVANAVVSSGSVILLEQSTGAVAYVPVGKINDEMDDECIPVGMVFNKARAPPRFDKIQLLSYLPGGFL